MKLKDYKEKKMQDPEFVKAYEKIQPEMNVIRAMIEARTSKNLTNMVRKFTEITCSVHLGSL